MGKARRAGLWRWADGRSTGWQAGEGQAASGCLWSCIPTTDPCAIHHNTTPGSPGPGHTWQADRRNPETAAPERVRARNKFGDRDPEAQAKHRTTGEETRGDLSRRAEHGLERHRRGPREKGELGMAPEAHTSLAALIRLSAMEEKGWGCMRLPQTGTTASRGSLPISHL